MKPTTDHAPGRRISARAAALALCLLLAALCGCAARPSTEEIVRFFYSVGDGWDSVRDSIEKEDSRVVLRTLRYDALGRREIKRSEKTGEIPEEALKALQEIVRERGILAWNGFDKEAESLMDGYGFGLEIEYADGTTVSAQGYGVFPEEFEEANAALSAFLSEWEDALPDTAP